MKIENNKVRPYRLPYAHNQEVNAQNSKLLDEEIITPSKTSCNSSLLLVPIEAETSGKVKWQTVIDLYGCSLCFNKPSSYTFLNYKATTEPHFRHNVLKHKVTTVIYEYLYIK
jgi:hypothetical protein